MNLLFLCILSTNCNGRGGGGLYAESNDTRQIEKHVCYLDYDYKFGLN